MRSVEFVIEAHAVDDPDFDFDGYCNAVHRQRHGTNPDKVMTERDGLVVHVLTMGSDT